MLRTSIFYSFSSLIFDTVGLVRFLGRTCSSFDLLRMKMFSLHHKIVWLITDCVSSMSFFPPIKCFLSSTKFTGTYELVLFFDHHKQH